MSVVDDILRLKRTVATTIMHTTSDVVRTVVFSMFDRWEQKYAIRARYNDDVVWFKASLNTVIWFKAPLNTNRCDDRRAVVYRKIRGFEDYETMYLVKPWISFDDYLVFSSRRVNT